MISEINIKNFKSIVDLTLPLSNINIFIGENGCGKSNILEAVAFLSLALGKGIDNESLFSKGVRNAKPELIFNSFKGDQQRKKVSFEFRVDSEKTERVTVEVGDRNEAIFPEWRVVFNDRRRHLIQQLNMIPKDTLRKILDDKFKTISELDPSLEDFFKKIEIENSSIWTDFAIFTPNALALRGFQVDSQKEPLGIFGENLDVLLSSLSTDEKNTLDEYKHLVSWLEEFEFDEIDAYKLKGYKTGRSKSRLYFRDKFMQKKNNIFSAENSNEGVLHILFHLALFISKQTPRFFAIDNIETALNPKLCRNLIKIIGKIAIESEKQALITTQNPAVLDGLNLNDDRQRLFVVKRNDDGYTQIERIKIKPQTNGDQLKLSEMWMRGQLGGLPNNF